MRSALDIISLNVKFSNRETQHANKAEYIKEILKRGRDSF